jgi:hypothetical protein
VSAALTNYGERLDPSGSEVRRILLIEELTADTVWITLHGDGAIFGGEDERRNLDVIVNDLCLGIAGGIERLGGVQDVDV